ncbi:MAG: GumC family protein [Devosia sp.]|nr:GumC family protein [Devosia sp.]
MSTEGERAEDLRMDMGAVFGAVWSRALRIGLVTLLLLIATAAVLLLLPKTYESSASLLVEQRENIYTRAAMEQPASTGSVDTEALMSSQIQLIRSRDLLLEVVDAENLRSVPEFSGAGFSPVNLLLQLVGRKLEPRNVDETVLGNLADRMTVIRERDSAVMSIYVRSTSADIAARIANALAAAHVKRRAAQSLADTVDATVWLQQEIDKLRSKVAAAEAAVANYKVDKDLFLGISATPVADQQLSTVATQIAEAQQRKNDAQSRADLIRGVVASGQSLEGLSDVRGSVVIQSLLQTKGNLQADLAQKSTTLLANHPTIKALKAQIAEIEAQVVREGRRVADSLEAEASIEADLEARLREDLANAKLQAGTATRDGVTLDGLEREAKAQRDLLENYLAKYSDALSRSASNAAMPDVRIVSEAAPSVEAAFPKVPLTLAAVGLVALVLQVGAVVFGELTSGRALRPSRAEETQIDDIDDVEAGIGAESEESLVSGPPDIEPATPGAASAAVSSGTARDDLAMLSAVVTARQLRVLLIAGLDDHGPVASVVDRLLDDVLQADLSVVVVDAGSGKPSLEAGLADLAAERVDYGDVVQRASDNLAEVSWGRLAAIDRRSARPLTLVEALADLYHVVIVDTGRLGLSSSLPLFADLRATVILVADADAPQTSVVAARRDIAAIGFETGRVVRVPVLRADVA